MGVDDCQRFPGLKCLLLRRVGKANIEHFQDLRQRLFGALPHTFAAHRGVLQFDNGSQIVAGHFQKDSDIDNYLGLEYDVIGIEEATTLTSRKYTEILTCLRSSKVHGGVPWRPRIYSNANPGGVGHAWYRQRYVDPFRSRTETETRFIPSGVADNVFNNVEYTRILERLAGWQRRAWLDGDWDIQAGQYFSSFRRDVHVIKDFDPAKAQQWFASLDYGYSHYTVCLLGCQDGDGNYYVVDEHADRGKLPRYHAEAIREMFTRNKAWPVRTVWAGSDVFARESDGTTIAATYQDEGISLRPAFTGRVHGWATILRLLGDPGNGIPPKLFIHERCTRLIDCLPTLQRDPNDPEDVLKTDCDEEGVGGDDPADALRYLLARKPASFGALAI
jgi:phage terminase large subunit